MKAEFVVTSVAWAGACLAYYRASKLTGGYNKRAGKVIRTDTLHIEVAGSEHEKLRLEKLFDRQICSPMKTAYGAEIEDQPI